MNDSGIINYFGQTYGWDVLAQGIIFMACFTYSLGILYCEEYHSSFRKQINSFTRQWLSLISIKPLLDPNSKHVKPVGKPRGRNSIHLNIDSISQLLPSRRGLILTATGLSLLYLTGIGIGQMADKWMDKYNFMIYPVHDHESLSKCSQEYYESDTTFNGRNVDNLLKIDGFNKVLAKDICLFGKQNRAPGSKVTTKGIAKTNIYYAAKHLLLKDDQWSKYLSVSQISINLLQVAILSFNLIVICLLVKSIKTIFRSNRKTIKEYNQYINGSKIIFLSTIISVILIFITLSYASSIIGATPIYTIFDPTSSDIPWLSWFLSFLALVLLIAIFVTVFEFCGISRNKIRLLLNLCGLILITVGIIWALSSSWIQNEKEINLKTYGALKVLDPCLLKTNELLPVMYILYGTTTACK